MQIQQRLIRELKPHSTTLHTNEKAIHKVADSIKVFGWQQPIVVDKNDVIVVGFTRYLAAQHLELESAPVVVADNLSPEQINAYRIADNKLATSANFNDADLLHELQALSDESFALTGFTESEMTALDGFTFTDENESASTEDIEPLSQLGDLWHLGPHRLLCGDATNAEHVNQLMNGGKADLLFTDPPYNVNYQGKRDDALTIQNDHLSESDFKALLDTALSLAKQQLQPHASFYICHGFSMQQLLQDILRQLDYTTRNQIIWGKNHFVQSHARFKQQHELMFYGHLMGEQDRWFGNNKQTTLWSIPKPGKNIIHPTMKPQALVEKALINSTKKDELVFDPFGGSGTTLMACEAWNRRACLLEIDPKYVDAIIERWQDKTGLEAMHAIKRQSYNALKSAP